ncbi:MAG TPA: hypothetical protein VL400_06000, partial [Polyangiaceae bacterium]|nr:hypothetical protein [Polyangiaceae bacterium]
AAGVMFYIASDKPAPLPEIDRGTETPVKVLPVIDEEMITARLGGKKAVLPDMWQRAPASVKKAVQEKPPPPEIAAPSPEAEATKEAIPDKDKKVASVDAGRDWGKEDDEDASTKEPQEGSDAGLENATEDAGVATLDTDGGSNGAPNEGCTGPGCTPDGGLDKFQEAQYVGRLIGFFKRGFVVNGLGLPPEEIQKLSVSVSVKLDGLTVSSFNMTSSGNAAFDAAARSAMQAKVGQQVPPPPEDRPDLQRPSLSFSMTCSSSCN